MKTPQRVELSHRLQRQGLAAASVGDIVRDLRENRDASKYATLMVERAVPLTDIEVRKDGTGRTVDAYAAVFMTPTEIVDADGHYKEQNDPGAFNATLAQRRDQIFCIYNHGRTLQGTPSDLYSVPVGVPTLSADGRATPYADSRGLFTSTVYNSDPESDRILEAIRSGSLKGMSYTGVFVRSVPELQGPRDFYEPDSDGNLTLVTRMEIALIEYGATPIPAFETATVVGVRSRESVTLARRSATMLHHTPVNYSSTWHENTVLNDMHFPATQDDMNGMFAYYDERAAGTDPGTTDAGQDQGSFPRYAGYLPHHDVVNGKPGAANTAGVAQCLAQIDTLPDNFYGATKDSVRSHLLAHQADEDPAKTGVNPTSVQAQQDPDKLTDTTSSSGRRDDEDDHDRADTSALNHDDMSGQHSHAHIANADMDAGDDGVHMHMHAHNGDHEHAHSHTGTDPIPVAVRETPVYSGMSSSGREPEEGDERADNKPYGNVEYADPKNGKYPIDAEHVVAAWSYINKPENADKYPLNGVKLSEVKAKIKAAMKKHGHEVSEGGGSGNNGGSSSSGRQPAAPGTGPRNGDSARPQSHPAPSASHEAREHGMTHDDTVRMTVGERIERQSAVRARLAELDSEYLGAELPADARSEWRQLQEELLTHQKAIKDAQERAQYLAMISESPDHTEGVDNGPVGFDRSAGVSAGTLGDYHSYGSAGRSSGGGVAGMRGTTGPAFRPDLGDAIYDLTAIRNRARSIDEVPSLYREYAMRAVDRARFPSPEKTREDCQGTIERLLLNVDDNQGTLARRLLVTGSPLYDRAFGKALQGMSLNGLSAEESRSLALGVDGAGGFAVPFQLDPTVILTSNGAINPLRQISRIEQIVGKEWDGVTSAGVVVTRVAEGTEAATGDALFLQPKVRTTRIQGFVPFNIELDVSWGALRSQMTSLLMDAKDVEEATSFVTGSGTAPQAQGVVQNAHDQSETVSTAGTALLAIGDLYALENAMPPRFRQQSSYLASKTTFNRFRQLFQAQASAAFDSWVRPSAGTPATFNGYPAYEASAMATTITSGSFVLLQGDFSKFLIVDRVGMGIELIPHLFGGTNRFPVGQRGILAIWFNNSQVLVNNAFRLLVTT